MASENKDFAHQVDFTPLECHSFICYHNEVLIVLVMQNTIPEKDNRYESNRNIIHPKYESIALAVYYGHVI